MEFLWGTLLFLTGWLVCWIQMSKSESQKVQQLQYLADRRLESLKSQTEERKTWNSKYQDLMRSKMYLDHDLSEMLSGYRILEAEYLALKEHSKSPGYYQNLPVLYPNQPWMQYPNQKFATQFAETPKDPTMQVWAQSHYNSEEPNR